MAATLFGDWLKQRRELLGLTRPILAEQVRCSQKTLQNIECNQQRPSRSLAGRLLAALNVAPAELAALLRLARPFQGLPGAVPPLDEQLDPLEIPPLAISLPQALTPLIGRERDCAAILALLASTPCLTITGPGGVGKTRLAIEVARQAYGEYPGGVWFIGLDTLEEFGSIVPRIIGALHLQLMEQPAAISTLIRALSQRKALLLLDTCEHLLPTFVHEIAELIQNCNQLTLLVTSCEPLRSTYETVYALSPFPCPDPDQISPADLAHFDSVRLFLDRARAGNPCWHPTPAQIITVARICQRLDGLPLALELAAARLRVLPIEEIIVRLPGSLFDQQGVQTMPTDRHQTLRALFDWSYVRLSPLEQRLFRHLAIFAGGWTLETLEPPWNDGASSSIGMLGNLVDKSLVIREVKGAGIRYRMLECIRSYAWERLIAAGEATAAYERHIQTHLSLVERAAAHLIHSMGAIWYARLYSELENLQAGLKWCLAQPWAPLIGSARADITVRISAAMRLCAVLWRVWDYHGHPSGLTWLEQILVLSADPPTNLASELRRLRTECLLAAGNLAQNQGFLIKANAYYTECLDCYRVLGDEENTIRVSNLLGWNLCTRGLFNEAERLLTSSLALARASQNQRGIAQALNSLSVVLRSKGAIDQALSLNGECLASINQLDNYQWYIVVLTNMAGILLAAGEAESAEMYLLQTLIHQETQGHRRNFLLALSTFGLVRWHQKRYGEAWAAFREAYREAKAIHFIRGAIAALLGIAISAGAWLKNDSSSATQDWSRVVQLFAAAHACAEQFDYAIDTLYRAPLDLIMNAARSQLGAAEFDDHWAAGKSTAPEGVMAMIEGTAFVGE